MRRRTRRQPIARDYAALFAEQRAAYRIANSERDAAMRAARAECVNAKREADRRFEEGYERLQALVGDAVRA